MNRLHLVLRMLVVAFALIVGVQPALALPITLDVSGVSGSNWGNTWTFSSGGVTVTASAWSYTKTASDNALESAQLGYTSGIGVCNRSEGLSCSGAHQQLDNSGGTTRDWVLFEFSEAVDITSLNIDPTDFADRDVTYWTANITDPTFTGNLDGKTYASLSTLFGAAITDESTESDAARDVSIGGGLANYLLIGAQKEGTNDYFKIKSITVTPTSVAEPATLLLLGSAVATLGLRRRRRQLASTR